MGLIFKITFLSGLAVTGKGWLIFEKTEAWVTPLN